MGDGSHSEAAKIALELMKQLITLSSGVLVLSATFISQLNPAVPYLLLILVASWCCLITAIVSALKTISALIKSHLKPDLFDWSTGTGQSAAKVSRWSFIAGISLFAVFALVVLITGTQSTS